MRSRDEVKCDANMSAMPMGMQDHCDREDDGRVTLERKGELFRIAEDIARLLRGRVKRRERCYLRNMVEMLMDGEP